MDNIVIVGSSGHAKVVIDIVVRQGRYRIAGLIDRFRSAGEETLGHRILGKEEDLPRLNASHGLAGFIVGIGDNFIRSQVATRIQDLCPDLPLVSAVHPAASIATGVTIGAGTAIMAGACVNPLVTLGRGCILNTNAAIDHDSSMGDFSSLGPRVATGGNCHIGNGTAVGIGATLVHGVRIGDDSVIGAASLVVGPIGSLVVAYGTPARVVRDRARGDKYL